MFCLSLRCHRNRFNYPSWCHVLPLPNSHVDTNVCVSYILGTSPIYSSHSVLYKTYFDALTPYPIYAPGTYSLLHPESSRYYAFPEVYWLYADGLLIRYHAYTRGAFVFQRWLLFGRGLVWCYYYIFILSENMFNVLQLVLDTASHVLPPNMLRKQEVEPSAASTWIHLPTFIGSWPTLSQDFGQVYTTVVKNHVQSLLYFSQNK